MVGEEVADVERPDRVLQALSARGLLVLAGAALGMLILTVIFAQESDTTYFWIGAYLINQGLQPHTDFLYFQFPDVVLYLYSIFIPFVDNILVQRALFALALMGAGVGGAVLLNRDRTRFAVVAISVMALTLLFFHHDAVAHLVQLRARTAVSAAALLLACAAVAPALAENRLRTGYAVVLVLSAFVFTGAKLLNLPELLLLLALGWVRFRDRRRVLGKALLVVGAVGLLVWLLHLDVLRVGIWQAYELQTGVMARPFWYRFRMENLVAVLGYSIYYYGFFGVVLWYGLRWLRRLGVSDVSTRMAELALLLVAAHVLTYGLGPPRAAWGYFVNIVPVLALATGQVLWSLVEARPSVGARGLRLAGSGLALVLLVQTAAAVRSDYFISAGSEAVHPKGGLVQHMDFQRVADAIRSYGSGGALGGAVALRFSQPIVMASAPLHTVSALGTTLPDVLELELSDATAREYHVTNRGLFQELMCDARVWVLTGREFAYLSELAGSADAFEPLPPYQPGGSVNAYVTSVGYRQSDRCGG